MKRPVDTGLFLCYNKYRKGITMKINIKEERRCVLWNGRQ